jgi:hypothetical protein
MGQASASFTGAGSAFKASLTRQARELKLCLWLKQLGGHLFVPAGPVARCGGTTTPGHIGQLPRQASGYHASELFGGLETDSRSMISPSPSAWQTFADLLDPPENPCVRDSVSTGQVLRTGQQHLSVDPDRVGDGAARPIGWAGSARIPSST